MVTASNAEELLVNPLAEDSSILEFEGTFECKLCVKKLYSPPGSEKQSPIVVNKAILRSLDDVIPVTCDKYPEIYVSWYNKDEKMVASNEAVFSRPESF